MATVTARAFEGIPLISTQVEGVDDLNSRTIPRESLRDIGRIQASLCEWLDITSGPVSALLDSELKKLSKTDLGVLEYRYVLGLISTDVERVMKSSEVSESCVKRVEEEIQRIARAKLGVSEELVQSLAENRKSGKESRDQRIFDSARRVAILLRLDSELLAKEIIELKVGQVDLKAGKLRISGGKVFALCPLTVGEIRTYLEDLAAVSGSGWPLDPKSKLILREDALETLRIADRAEESDIDTQKKGNGSNGISQTAKERVKEADRRRTKKSQHPKGTNLPKEPIDSSQVGRTVASNVLQLKQPPQQEVPAALANLVSALEVIRRTPVILRLSDQADFSTDNAAQLEESMRRIETIISRGSFGSTPVIDGIKMEFGLIRIRLNAITNQPAGNQPSNHLLSAAALITACDNELQGENRSAIPIGAAGKATGKAIKKAI